MYNLIIGWTDGTVPTERMLEYTPDHLLDRLKPVRSIDGSHNERRLGNLDELTQLPTIVMPEPQQAVSGEVARLGTIQRVAQLGRAVTYAFVPSPSEPLLDLSLIEDNATTLGIHDWELSRSHWAVKDVDLYRTLWEIRAKAAQQTPASAASPASLAREGAPALRSGVLTFPTDAKQEADLVAVMMPFDKGLADVYATIRETCQGLSLRCSRADDIWENDTVMDDVTSLLWRASVVIADLTDKNANVFFETGVAYTLGRNVILLTQQAADVPFDLRHVRYLRYLNNREGLNSLRSELSERLKGLLARS